MHASIAPRARRGFTLVEMLVVVVIIGILAGLITGVAAVARRAARKAVIRAEINDLDLALKAFKEKFGDYPPDFSDIPLVQRQVNLRFLQKAFPRYIPTNPNDPIPQVAYAGYAMQGADPRPAMALVFWLGGMVDPATGNFVGFSANPANPFEPPSVNPSRIQPFFDFDRNRLRITTTGNNQGITGYMPNNGVADSDPYLYFRSNYYQVDTSGNPIIADQATKRPRPKCYILPESTTTQVLACPYYDSQLAGTQNWATPDAFWANRTSFQILSPGLDGRYWNPGDPLTQDGDKRRVGIRFPIGDDYTRAQYDDITNFSDGALEDKTP